MILLIINVKKIISRLRLRLWGSSAARPAAAVYHVSMVASLKAGVPQGMGWTGDLPAITSASTVEELGAVKGRGVYSSSLCLQHIYR